MVEYQDKSGNYKRLAGELARALTGPNILMYRKDNTSYSYESPRGSNGGSGRWLESGGTVFYLQKKGEDNFVAFDLDNSKQLIKWVEDYDKAYEQALLAYQYTKKVRMHRIIGWGAIISGGLLIIADPGISNDFQLGATGYAGAALASAGIINLSINIWGRSRKGYKAYTAAIDLYNEMPVKGKK